MFFYCFIVFRIEIIKTVPDFAFIHFAFRLNNIKGIIDTEWMNFPESMIFSNNKKNDKHVLFGIICHKCFSKRNNSIGHWVSFVRVSKESLRFRFYDNGSAATRTYTLIGLRWTMSQYTPAILLYIRESCYNNYVGL